MNSQGKPAIHIVDDDEAMRDSLQWLLDTSRFAVSTYASAEAFLECYTPEPPACIILDIRMPGISGVELFEHLTRRAAAGAARAAPVIFVTGHGDVPMAVEAIKRGAFDFIEKPFNEQKLLAIIERALAENALAAAAAGEQLQLAARLGRLSPRECEVLDMVVAGKMNKTIADAMNISIKTVESHRARVMEKMDAHSLAELVQRVMTARPASSL